MINFFKKYILNKFLRLCLKLIPSFMVVSILNGKLKGKKWIKGSGVNGYWLGNYEIEKQKFFEKIVRQGDVVYDIGAHVGFFSLLSAELVGKSGKVFAFEPLPRNIKFLKKHIEINKYKNIIIFENAVSDKEENVFFGELINSFSGRIVNRENGIRVKAIVLDNSINSGKLLPPNVMKIDVEENEMKVLFGAKNILKKYKPFILLSTHSEKIYNDCVSFLSEFKYKSEPIVEENSNKTSEVFLYYEK